MVFGNGKKSALGHFLSAFAGLAEAQGPRKPRPRGVPAAPQKRGDGCHCGGPRRPAGALSGLRRPAR